MVFSYAPGGPWSPQRVFEALPEGHGFDAIWVFSLNDVIEGRYTYGVSNLHVTNEYGKVPRWLVRIAKEFDDWQVERQVPLSWTMTHIWRV